MWQRREDHGYRSLCQEKSPLETEFSTEIGLLQMTISYRYSSTKSSRSHKKEMKYTVKLLHQCSASREVGDASEDSFVDTDFQIISKWH